MPGIQENICGAVCWMQQYATAILRDKIILPDVSAKFNDVDVKLANRIFNERFPDLDRFRKWETVTCDGIKIQVEYIEFVSKEQGPKHTVLRIGGADELLTLSPSRFKPFIKAQLKQNGKEQFRFLQVTIRDLYDAEGHPWRPDSFKLFGDVVFALMEKLGKVDTLICHSLGSVALEKLEMRDPDTVPKNIVLERSLPSLWKAGRNTHGYAACFFLYQLGKLTNLQASPEDSVAEFVKKTDMKDRQVVVIEVANDFYFSGPGKMREVAQGVHNVFQHTFRLEQFRSHERAHHASLLSFVVNWEDFPIEMGGFTVNENESVVDALARQIFSKVGKE